MKKLTSTLRNAGCAAALLVMLAGCGGGATQMHYYNLPAITRAPLQKQAPHNATQLAVSPVTLSSYIDGSGIVYQTSPVEYKQAQLNLWADDIAEQLTNQVRSELGQRLGYYQVLPATADTSNAEHLNIQLDQFQGRYDGNAVVQGSYQLYDNEQHLLLEQPIAVTVPLKSDGYDALVRALGQGWQQAAQRIAVELDSHARTQAMAPASAHGQPAVPTQP